MNKPRKQPNQYTVKRDKPSLQAAKEAEPADKVQPLPSIAELTAKRDLLVEQLGNIEKQIQGVEDRYLVQSSPLGNAVTGYEGLLSGNVVPHQDMRLFTASSATWAPPAPAAAAADVSKAVQPAVPPPNVT